MTNAMPDGVIFAVENEGLSEFHIFPENKHVAQSDDKARKFYLSEGKPQFRQLG
jgi:hypothetical protein